MKKISIISAIVALALPFMAVAQTLPNKTLQDVSGKNVELKSLIDGKTPFVLSFWMTTCKPCMIELEALTDEIADWSESWPLRIYAALRLSVPPWSPRCSSGGAYFFTGITPSSISEQMRRGLSVQM